MARYTVIQANDKHAWIVHIGRIRFRAEAVFDKLAVIPGEHKRLFRGLELIRFEVCFPKGTIGGVGFVAVPSEGVDLQESR